MDLLIGMPLLPKTTALGFQRWFLGSHTHRILECLLGCKQLLYQLSYARIDVPEMRI